MKQYAKLINSSVSLMCLGMMLLLASCNSSNKNQTVEVKAEQTDIAVNNADTTVVDTLQTKEGPVYLSYVKTMDLLNPDNKSDEKSVEALFNSIELAKQLADRYNAAADFGGDSPAISYCFGNDVKFENYTLSGTSDNYFGTHFNLFFEENSKSGHINAFSIITSDKNWYDKFMKAAEEDGFRFIKDVDPAVYGKKGKGYQKKAPQNPNTTESTHYYINDFSTESKFDLEIGYDSGMDI